MNSSLHPHQQERKIVSLVWNIHKEFLTIDNFEKIGICESILIVRYEEIITDMENAVNLYTQF